MDIDSLCDELETSKLFKDGDQEWQDLTFSTRMGFLLLSKDSFWVMSSIARYKKYLRYVNFNLTEDGLVVHNLINEYINISTDEIYNNLPLVAAKAVAIDKLLMRLVEFHESQLSDDGVIEDCDSF